MKEGLSGEIAQPIYQKIKELLFSGKILYGERFTEAHIAEIFDVSRMPVREAFKLLTYEGFIEKTETTGYQIKKISEQDIIDTYSFRECVDGMLTNLFTYKHTPSQIFYLENILQNMENQKDSGNELAMSKIDQEFHRTIARGAGNQQMLVHFELLMQKIIFINHVLIHNKLKEEASDHSIYTARHSLSVYHEHKDIIEYIKLNKPEDAERCARRSVREGLKKVLEILAYRCNHNNFF